MLNHQIQCHAIQHFTITYNAIQYNTTLFSTAQQTAERFDGIRCPSVEYILIQLNILPCYTEYSTTGQEKNSRLQIKSPRQIIENLMTVCDRRLPRLVKLSTSHYNRKNAIHFNRSICIAEGRKKQMHQKWICDKNQLNKFLVKSSNHHQRSSNNSD